jgi:hypothetical protein
MFGFLPPSSKDNFLNIGAAIRAILLPVSVPPVNEIALTVFMRDDCGTGFCAEPVNDVQNSVGKIGFDAKF